MNKTSVNEHLREEGPGSIPSTSQPKSAQQKEVFSFLHHGFLFTLEYQWLSSNRPKLRDFPPLTSDQSIHTIRRHDLFQFKEETEFLHSVSELRTLKLPQAHS